MHIHRYPYTYIDAHTSTHTHTHHTHTNIHPYTLYIYIHIQWNGLLMHLIHRHTLHYRTLWTHIFPSKNALTLNHNPRSINCSLKKDNFVVSYQLPTALTTYHSYLLSYKRLVQRIFQIVQYHLWCHLLEVFAIRYIDEPTYSHSTQFYFLDYRCLYDLLHASKYRNTKLSPAFGLSK